MAIRIDGTNAAANPGITGADADTGLQFGTDEVSIVTGGTERVKINSAGSIEATSAADVRLTLGSSGTAGTNDSVHIRGDGPNLLFMNGAGGITSFEQNGTERARITSTGDFEFNSGYGSVATAYGVRAWVNFNGEGAVAIRGSGNVSSITDNGLGDYTLNFSNAMPDANYGVVTGLSDISNNADAGFLQAPYITAPSTSAFRFRTVDVNYSQHKDCEYVYLAFIR